VAELNREVGAATDLFSRTIERVKLIEYKQALKLHNPIHFDAAAARALGYRDVVAPLGFVISFTVIPREVKLSTFGIDEKRSLAGGMAFETLQPICAGDTLTGRCVLKGARHKDGKRPMTILRFETRFTNQLEEPVLVVSDTTLEMGS